MLHATLEPGFFSDGPTLYFRYELGSHPTFTNGTDKLSSVKYLSGTAYAYRLGASYVSDFASADLNEPLLRARNDADRNHSTAGMGRSVIRRTYKSTPHASDLASQHTIPTAMSNASNYSLPQAESSMDPYSLIHLQQVLRMIGLIWGEYNQLLTDIIYTNNSP